VLPFYVAHSSDPELVRQVLLAAAARHPDVLADPPAEVEFVEAGLAALRFQLQVWSLEHLKTAGTLKSDLNFEVWRQLASAGVTIREPGGAVMLGLQFVTTPKP
jgi:small-conductance mechanosensitive channel